MGKAVMTVALAAAILMTAGCNTSVVTMLPPAEGQTSSSGERVVANLEGSNWGFSCSTIFRCGAAIRTGRTGATMSPAGTGSKTSIRI